MTRYAYPHTIDNGAGERLTFFRRVAGPNGDRIEGDTVVEPGAGPPMHLHQYSEEVFTVEEGRIGYPRLGEPERFGERGETVIFKPGEPHRFWNAGEVQLRCKAHVEPADNFEYLLTEIFESMRRHGGGRPDLFEIAFLARRYRNEYRMLAIPAVVQILGFPLIVAVGNLLGKYAKYRDAPEPVHR